RQLRKRIDRCVLFEVLQLHRSQCLEQHTSQPARGVRIFSIELSGSHHLGRFASASIDAYYSKFYSSIVASALSSTQVNQLAGLGYSVSNSLAATISDNTAY